MCFLNYTIGYVLQTLELTEGHDFVSCLGKPFVLKFETSAVGADEAVLQSSDIDGEAGDPVGVDRTGEVIKTGDV